MNLKKAEYNQTCIRQPLLGPLQSGRLGQVVVLQNTFKNNNNLNLVALGRFLVFIPTKNVL